MCEKIIRYKKRISNNDICIVLTLTSIILFIFKIQFFGTLVTANIATEVKENAEH